MKTAISIPDATFERAEHKARALGMTRSEFFTRAAVRLLDELDESSVTAQIDDALATLEEVRDESSADAVAIGRRVLAGQGDDW